MAKIKDISISVTLDDVLSEIDLEDALEWYRKDLGTAACIATAEEFIKDHK